MTTFDDRERSYEAKFARDAELNFKAEARRNRLLGEWAAGVLGKTGDEARADRAADSKPRTARSSLAASEVKKRRGATSASVTRDLGIPLRDRAGQRRRPRTGVAARLRAVAVSRRSAIPQMHG